LLSLTQKNGVLAEDSRRGDRPRNRPKRVEHDRLDPTGRGEKVIGWRLAVALDEVRDRIGDRFVADVKLH
jgi:hypothetical protein